MAIEIGEDGRTFTLLTERTEYQLRADERGVLQHVWYGARTGCDMSYLLEFPDVGFSGNVYDAGDCRAYSLDTLPLEYSCRGAGDYRLAAVAAEHAHGGNALDLRFAGYEVRRGKYALPGLPHAEAGEEDAQTLQIVLRDASGVTVTLLYGVFAHCDVITRCARIENGADAPVYLTAAHSLCLDTPHGDWEQICFDGRHTMERVPSRAPLAYGVRESASDRGISSHQHNPAVILCEKRCDESRGACIGAALMYSGAFEIRTERT
ncbi:MAG: alpha-galactosidase, partial [Clostridiales bacterium]|nr:alpha-galactosidase [Clostridiales bacterium]